MFLWLRLVNYGSEKDVYHLGEKNGLYAKACTDVSCFIYDLMCKYSVGSLDEGKLKGGNVYRKENFIRDQLKNRSYDDIVFVDNVILFGDGLILLPGLK